MKRRTNDEHWVVAIHLPSTVIYVGSSTEPRFPLEGGAEIAEVTPLPTDDWKIAWINWEAVVAITVKHYEKSIRVVWDSDSA
jgi:hypothetical protein